jgi:molecular chaperone GrpE
MVREIFEIVDDLNRATLNDASNDSLKMILNKLLGILNNFGYIPINFKEGDSFEAEKMEAISTVPVQEEEKNGKIVHVDQIGFIYKEDESIIRPAKVIVGKKV